MNDQELIKAVAEEVMGVQLHLDERLVLTTSCHGIWLKNFNPLRSADQLETVIGCVEENFEVFIGTERGHGIWSIVIRDYTGQLIYSSKYTEQYSEWPRTQLEAILEAVMKLKESES